MQRPTLFFLQQATVMSFRAFIVSLPLLWKYTTAFPAGPGYFPNNQSSPVNDVHVAAYGLIDSYDASNWLSKFDVQAVSKTSSIEASANPA